MTLIDLLALAFATKACLDVWLDEDSILAEWRAITQTWNSWFWRTLFNCRFCLSYHTPVWLILVFYATSLFLPHPWSVVAKLPIYSLATTGIVWVIDWAVKDRTPKSRGASTKDDYDGTSETTSSDKSGSDFSPSDSDDHGVVHF